MNKKICNALVGVAVGLAVSGAAVASSVSYYLDKSNTTSLFPDNTDYLQVTIDDLGLANDKIYFTVTPLAPLTSIAGSNFGIDKFAFNGPTLAQSNIGLAGWSLSNNKNVSIFGKFNNLLKGGGNSRSNPLTFSISAGNDTIASYAAVLSNGSAFFAAHVAGFDIACSNGGSDDEKFNKNIRRSHSSFIHHSTSHEGDGGNCERSTSAYFGGSTSRLVPLTSAVPVPAAAWLFASGLIGMVCVSRRSRTK
jgi:hypothetical protein